MSARAVVAGVGMTPFGKHAGRSLKSLAGEAIGAALADAGIEARALQAAWMGNAAAAVISGQVCVPGQVMLRALGIGRIPVVNVENACATASTAFQQAATSLAAPSRWRVSMRDNGAAGAADRIQRRPPGPLERGSRLGKPRCLPAHRADRIAGILHRRGEKRARNSLPDAITLVTSTRCCKF